VSKNKKGKKKLPEVLNKIVFIYTSVCCGERAKKPAVRRSAEDRAANEYSQCGLGTWRCGKCGKKAKAKRSKNTPKETDGSEATNSTASTETNS
jgi:hypothetical protein